MEWNEDLASIPYGDEVLLKVKYKQVPYYTFHLCEKWESKGGNSGFLLTDSDDENLTTEVEIIAWVDLEKESEL